MGKKILKIGGIILAVIVVLLVVLLVLSSKGESVKQGVIDTETNTYVNESLNLKIEPTEGFTVSKIDKENAFGHDKAKFDEEADEYYYEKDGYKLYSEAMLTTKDKNTVVFIYRIDGILTKNEVNAYVNAMNDTDVFKTTATQSAAKDKQDIAREDIKEGIVSTKTICEKEFTYQTSTANFTLSDDSYYNYSTTTALYNAGYGSIIIHAETCDSKKSAGVQIDDIYSMFKANN